MKIIEKLLYFIAGLLALIFLFMLVSIVNPTAHDIITDIVNKITHEDEKQASQQASTADVSVYIPGNTQTDETEQHQKSVPEPENNSEPAPEKTYEEYVSDWSDDGIDDEFKNDSTYDKFVKDFTEGFIDGFTGNDEDSNYSEDEYRKAFEDSNESRSDYKVPEAEVEIVEDEEQAEEVVKDVDVGETGENETFDPLFYPYYNILNDKGKRLYKQIYANAIALNESFLPVEDATGKEWNTAMFSVIYDHPELFWVDASLYKQYDYNGNVIRLDFYYFDELPDIPAARQVFEAKAEEMIQGAKDLGSDFEKEKYIHDLLDNKLTYDWGDLNQSAYSAIVYDTTVCAGYSKGFQYLMQKLQVPTYTCVGWGGFGLLFGGMHGWNIIKLDSDYYNVDCTWDDDEPISYEYFNLSDDDNYMHTRMFNSVYLPPCNGGKYSGLVKRSLSDYGISDGDVITNMDAYYAYCKDKTLNESVIYDEDAYECEFQAVISGDIYNEWKRDYDQSKEYDKYLNEVIRILGNGDQYDLFIPIGLVLCDEEQLSDGNWLITHYVYLGYAGTDF
ncbi:MAG: hypothetical protein J6N21_07890 [Butyrivibrio sp.]|nr:hypothetical protein [Butyrivibrio sp.]